jgi:hypothetical protein
MLSTLLYALAAQLGVIFPVWVLWGSPSLSSYIVALTSHLIGIGLFIAAIKKIFLFDVDKNADTD